MLPIGQSGEVPMFSGVTLGIETKKLAYFALSLVWKGSLGPWQTLEGQTTTVSLGQFQETVRLYLSGETEWPSEIVIVATVCTDSGSQAWINAPWPIPSDLAGGNFKRIELLTRGIWFWVLLGQVPKQIAEWCCASSPHKILFVRDCTDQLLLSNRHFIETAENRIPTPRLN